MPPRAKARQEGSTIACPPKAERSLIRRGGLTPASAASTQSPTEHGNLGVQGPSLPDRKKYQQLMELSIDDLSHVVSGNR
jgi:hypothetical protein